MVPWGSALFNQTLLVLPLHPAGLSPRLWHRQHGAWDSHLLSSSPPTPWGHNPGLSAATCSLRVAFSMSHWSLDGPSRSTPEFILLEDI